MSKNFLSLLLLACSIANAGQLRTWVIPIHGPIDYIQEYIVRRGLKQAQAAKCSHILLDIQTPGGNTHSMIKIAELLQKSNLETFAYINKEALSAGSFIAMCCSKIFFHPDGVMGAAAVIDVTGVDLGESLQAKIDSYLWAKLRNFCKKFPFRYEIQRAMMNKAFVWKDGEKILKPAGELLSLTAKEAMQTHGTNPALASDIFSTREALMQSENLTLVQVQKPTGFESLAKILTPFLSVFSFLGMVLLFLEFKTPGFGLWGCLGILFLSIPFLVHFLSGLGGCEPFIFFALGAIGIFLDLFIFNTFILMFLSLWILLGGLLWSGIDIWPNNPITWNDVFEPLKSISYTLLSWVLMFILAWKFGWIRSGLNRLTLFKSVRKKSKPEQNFIGQIAETITPLMPTGQAKIHKQIIEVRSIHGKIESYQCVRIVGKQDFSWLVESEEFSKTT